MADANKKSQSPLVESVLALDEHFSNLERLGAKIGDLDMKSDFDFEQAQRLLNLFAECGNGISTEITTLSTRLNEARLRAEAVATTVSQRADILRERKSDENQKMEEFRQLGEKVRELSNAINHFKRPDGVALTQDERASLATCLAQFEFQLEPLIEQAQKLRKQAHESKMRFLEQNADSLTQTLQSIRLKLGTMNLPAQ
jgi:chromosome segregation ATPase